MLDKSARRILQGNLPLEVARFGTPLAVGMALQTTFNLVDAYLIAQLPHAEVSPAIGALGICDQIAALGTILSYGVSTATSSLLAQQKGANDTTGVPRTAWQSLIIVGVLSLFFGVAGLAFAGFIVRDLIGAKGEVAAVAIPYLRIMLGGSFSIFFLLQLTSTQRALGSAKTPVALLIGGNILNVVLAVVFIFGEDGGPVALRWGVPIAKLLHIPRMGMLGAAWATILARAIVLVPNVIVLAKRFQIMRPRAGERGPDRNVLTKILTLGWPLSAQMVIRILAMLLVNSLVARFFTTPTDQTATTAIGVVFRLDTMALFIAMGWGSAAQTFVGQNIGAGQRDRAQKSGWIVTTYDIATSLLLWLLLLYTGNSILRIFVTDDGPISIAIRYLTIVAPTYVGLGIGVVLGNAMAGANATRTTLLIDVAVILGFQFPVAIAAVAGFGVSLDGLFRCVAITNVVSGIAYVAVYGRGRSVSRAPAVGEGIPVRELSA